MQRLLGALGAVLSRAESAVDADRRGEARIAQLVALGVDQLGRVLDGAAEGDREAVVVAVAVQRRAVDGAADREVLRAVGELDELG